MEYGFKDAWVLMACKLGIVREAESLPGGSLAQQLEQALFMTFLDCRQEVAKAVCDGHPGFIPAYQKIRGNGAQRPAASAADSLIEEELYEVCFDQANGGQPYAPDILNDIQYQVLSAAYMSYFPDTRDFAARSLDTYGIANGQSVTGSVPLHALVAFALWFCDYPGYREQVLARYSAVKAQSAGQPRRAQSTAPAAPAPRPQTTAAARQPQRPAPEPDPRLRYLQDFWQRFRRDNSYGMDDPDLRKKYLQYYMELNDARPLSLELRLGFLQILPGSPEFLYRQSGLVSAQYYLNEVSRAVNDAGLDGRRFLIGQVNSLPRYKAVFECIADELALEESNWAAVADQLDTLARRSGWDGTLAGRDETLRRKNSSRLFSMLRIVHENPAAIGDNLQISATAGEMVAEAIEDLMQRRPDIAGGTALLALSGMFCDRFAAKNRTCIDAYHEDYAAACDDIIAEMSRAGYYNSVTCHLIAAFAFSLLAGFRPDAATYLELINCLELEKDGAPAQELDDGSPVFAFLGYLSGFEAWFDRAFGTGASV